MSPIANAECRLTNLHGDQLATVTADGNGEFSFTTTPDIQGWLVCTPVGFPNLALTTFVSTVGSVAGEILPAQGREEVSPRTTVIAEILAQTPSSALQARKAELVAALQAHDPDLTVLVNAAIDLFDAMLHEPITTVDFSSTGSAEGGDTGSGGSGSGSSGSGSGSDSGGIAGATGDGAEASPFANASCEFVRDPQGDTALADLLLDGALDRPDIQVLTR
jgi:hypothetical protein